MTCEKEELLNAAVRRVGALEAKLIVTKKALHEALIRQDELLAYVDRKNANDQVSLVLLATKYVELIVPGYTHLQRAQPVLLPRLLLSYVEQVALYKLASMVAVAATRVISVLHRLFVLGWRGEGSENRRGQLHGVEF